MQNGPLSSPYSNGKEYNFDNDMYDDNDTFNADDFSPAEETPIPKSTKNACESPYSPLKGRMSQDELTDVPCTLCKNVQMDGSGSQNTPKTSLESLLKKSLEK